MPQKVGSVRRAIHLAGTDNAKPNAKAAKKIPEIANLAYSGILNLEITAKCNPEKYFNERYNAVDNQYLSN